MLPQAFLGFMQGPEKHRFRLHDITNIGTAALATLRTERVEHAGEPCPLTLEAS
jgi:hypothetical protein